MSEKPESPNLEDVITYHPKELTISSPGHPDRYRDLDDLADAVFTRYQRSGNMADLAEVITARREALVLHPPGHPHRSVSLDNLAIAVLARYEQLGTMEDLEEGIRYHCEILSLCPSGNPDRAASLNNLASAVLTRYEQSRRLDDIEDGITYYREALTLCPPGHPHRSTSLNNLALAVLTHFEQSGRMEELDEVITYYREALDLRPLGHSYRFLSLNSTALAVLTRYEQSGKIEDLEEGIKYRCEILSLCPPGNPDRATSLNNLASAVLTRYKRSGSIADIDEAITYYREALALCPPGHLDRVTSLNNLAPVVLTRYEQSGRMQDLEEGITYHREALTLHPLGHPHRPTSLNDLALAILTRFEQSGRMEELEEVITYYREASTLCPPDHPDRCMFLNDFVNTVLLCYEQSGRMQDLEEAIRCSREALTLCPPGHPNRSISLINLASVVHTRYEHSGRMEDLEEGITCHREALALCPPGHPYRSTCLSNLGLAVLSRYEHSGTLEDLEDGITYHREALTLCPPGHRLRSMSLNNLARAVHVRYQKSSMVDDLEEFFTLIEQAVNDLTASSKYRLAAAIHWAEQARHHHHSSVIRAYSMSLHLLDHCLIFYPDVNSQQNFLATVRIPKSLASDAASAAIDANACETAVELLERGRAILWSKLKGYRYPLDQLREVNTQLANDFETLNVQLEKISLSPEFHPTSQKPMSIASLESAMSRYRILTEQRRDMINQIRKIDGFGNFLQALPFTTLQTAAAEGPVILITISQYRSDAIILQKDKSPRVVTLPNVTPEQLVLLCEQLALARIQPMKESSSIIHSILRDLWNNIVSPVTNCLAQLAVPPKSRIWWCPTSALCALPLHAAGLYQSKGMNLPDIYTSSYTPTLSALISARSNIAIDRSLVPSLLVIGQPRESQNIQDEIDNVRRLGDFVNVIVGDNANRYTVLQGLRQHSWAHFACHSHLGDNSHPFHSSLVLHNSHLTLLDLMKTRLPNAELAFLTGGHSAPGDLSTPDENIHLVAGLQFCGFRSVVGTLWETNDEDGPIISQEFYKRMFRNPENQADYRDSAEALSLAICEMRRRGVPLERWTTFVHTGA